LKETVIEGTEVTRSELRATSYQVSPARFLEGRDV